MLHSACWEYPFPDPPSTYPANHGGRPTDTPGRESLTTLRRVREAPEGQGKPRAGLTASGRALSHRSAPGDDLGEEGVNLGPVQLAQHRINLAVTQTTPSRQHIEGRIGQYVTGQPWTPSTIPAMDDLRRIASSQVGDALRPPWPVVS